MNGLDLLTNQKFVSVAELQAGTAKLLALAEKQRSFYKVMKNNKPIGTLVPENVWNALITQLHLLSSKEFVKDINKATLEKEQIFLENLLNGQDSDKQKNSGNDK
jgi:PHD/YefM family antitoxin component YafN of YafNO toxin-antitoxin module